MQSSSVTHSVHSGPSTSRPLRKRRQSDFLTSQTSLSSQDRDLKAAIKKSLVDQKQIPVNYSQLKHCPVIKATHEDFNNPSHVWDAYSSIGKEYGVIKLIPPSNWKPPFSIDLEKTKFEVRTQDIHRLSIGVAFKQLKTLYTPSKLRDLDTNFKKQRFSPSASLEEIEKDYWKIIECGSEKVVAYYGADLSGSISGSAFPRQDDEKYGMHPWNLMNLSKVPGSLLRYQDDNVPGVTSPWLYIGMCFSSFCWHTEDNYFCAVNYQHFGDSKVWYVVAPDDADRLEELKKQYAAQLREKDVLHSLRLQVPLSIIIQNKIKITRVVQNVNEYVLLWPRAFHAGFNSGWNCNEACNFAVTDWIQFGFLSIQNYRFFRSSCISAAQLLLSSALDFESFSKNNLNDIIYSLALLIQQCNFLFCQDKLLKCWLFCAVYFYQNESKLQAYPLVLDESGLNALFGSLSSVKAISKTAFSESQAGIQALLYKNSHPKTFDELKILSKNRFSVLSKDCDRCKTSTIMGFVICPHSPYVTCFQCADVHKCSKICRRRAMYYRLSLPYLKVLLDRLILHRNQMFQADSFECKIDKLSNISLPDINDLIIFHNAKCSNSPYFSLVLSSQPSIVNPYVFPITSVGSKEYCIGAVDASLTWASNIGSFYSSGDSSNFDFDQTLIKSRKTKILFEPLTQPELIFKTVVMNSVKYLYLTAKAESEVVEQNAVPLFYSQLIANSTSKTSTCCHGQGE